MIIINKKRFEIGVRRANKYYRKIYWRPVWSGASDNFHSMENGIGFRFINTRSYFVMTTIQLFWLRWFFYIQIKPELISGETPSRWVKLEETHLDLLNLPHGKWSDEIKTEF